MTERRDASGPVMTNDPGMAGDAVGEPEPLGDAALTVRIGGPAGGERLRRVRAAAEAVAAAAIPGVCDVVASPGRVTLAYDPLAIAGIERLREAVSLALRGAGAAAVVEPAAHEIPVAYDGPDLERLCADRGIDHRRFVALHTEPDYLVEAIGFLPGFAYLAGLRTELATPRLATPRRSVPAGSVGVGGGQTGVYPFDSPGGWNLVGRTAVRLFDPGRPRPAVLALGDRVRFVAADLVPATAVVGQPVPEVAAAAVTVIEPGLFTTVQDLGRPGHRASGVPLSGAADALSLRLANLLVGNAETAAGLECTLLGPTLRFDREAVVALVGAPLPGLASNVATRVAAGTVIRLGHAAAGCRGYLAIAGGIDVPPLLGSSSTLAAAGLGGLAGRPLRAGDRLGLGGPGGPLPRAGATQALRELAAAAAPGGARHGRGGVLRIVPGEHAAEAGDDAWSRSFTVSSRSDRMGARLEGASLSVPPAAAGLPSVAVFPGTVQLPPDGRPIVLLADAQTSGGYPVLGQVIAADLPIAAQLRPGAEVRFEPVSLAGAHAALRASAAAVAGAREGAA